MPWKVTEVMDERMRFIVAAQAGTLSMTSVCASFGISRETGYKWLARYTDGGIEALSDISRARREQPASMPGEIARLLLALRKRRPRWGPKKLRGALMRGRPELIWPASSTIGDLLRREGKVTPRRVRSRGVEQIQAHSTAHTPNEIWGIDFKGWFRTRDGTRCDPLTVTDIMSRYLLLCQIVAPTLEGVWPACQRLFAEHGQPRAFRMDNGSPFGSKGAAGLTRLSVLWVKLGIALEPITPGCPGENGRHERMHRTLKQETSAPPAASPAEQQCRFDRFRVEFNEVRPHEALGQQTPASVHRPNARLYTGRLDDPWYDADHVVHRVLATGQIRWHGALLYISEALAGELIGLAVLPSGDHVARFAAIDLGMIIRGTGNFVRFGAARPGRAKVRPDEDQVSHTSNPERQ
jgi:putative transposase